ARRLEAAVRLDRLVSVRPRRARLRARREHRIREPALRRGAEPGCPARGRGRPEGPQPGTTQPGTAQRALRLSESPVARRRLRDLAPLRFLLLLPKPEFQSPLHPRGSVKGPACLRFVTTLSNLRNQAGLASAS